MSSSNLKKENPPLTLTPNITLPAALAALRACQETATTIGVPMNIAIVDTSLYLLAFARMPGAKLTSIDLAINKAFTAAGHRLGTHAYREKATVSGAPLTGVHVSNGGRFVTIAGGLPVVLPGGVVVGAVGVSAGAPEEDRRVAQAGVDAVLALVREAGGLEDVGRVKARL